MTYWIVLAASLALNAVLLFRNWRDWRPSVGAYWDGTGEGDSL